MAELRKRVSELLTNGFFVKQTCLLLNTGICYSRQASYECQLDPLTRLAYHLLPQFLFSHFDRARLVDFFRPKRPKRIQRVDSILRSPAS